MYIYMYIYMYNACPYRIICPQRRCHLCPPRLHRDEVSSCKIAGRVTRLISICTQHTHTQRSTYRV